MTKTLPFFVLDGANTIGGTKILLKQGGHGLLLDFGVNYDRFGKFFEEYLKPRSPCGLTDLWLLGIIPPFQELYRDDLKIGALPNSHDLPVDEIDAVVVSHVHMDHVGLVSLLKPSIPIVSSATTMAVLRAIQDSGTIQFYQEIAYILQREVESRRSYRFLESPNWRREAHRGRNAIVIAGVLSEELRSLWQRQANPDGSGRGMTPGEISTWNDSQLEWKIEALSVDHSILGACGFSINTERGRIIYTGDLRMKGTRRSQTECFIQRASELHPWILITEGTQVTRENECVTSEEECKNKCAEAVEAARDRLAVADFSARNVERLNSFHEIAQRTGRKLVILAKDAYLLDCLHSTERDIPLPSSSLLIYDTPKASEGHWEDWIFNHYQDFVVDASSISAAQGEYILAFSFFDIKYLNDIIPEQGLYLYSSSEPYTEEQKIDFIRLYNWLSHYNFEIKGFRMEDEKPVLEQGFHCSGHITVQELEGMIREINPEILVPIHTQDPQWFQRKFGDSFEVILPTHYPQA